MRLHEGRSGTSRPHAAVSTAELESGGPGSEAGPPSEEREPRKASDREAWLQAEGREDFLSTAAHEFKTALTAMLLDIASVSRSLRPGAEPIPREELASRLERAARQVDRVARLVDEMLDASVGRSDLWREDDELGAVVRRMAARKVDELAGTGCLIETAPSAPTQALELPRVPEPSGATVNAEP